MTPHTAASTEGQAEIVLSEQFVTVRRKGTSTVVVAKILGSRPQGGATVRLWLDRRVHRAEESTLGGYPVSGVRTTEMLVSAI